MISMKTSANFSEVSSGKYQEFRRFLENIVNYGNICIIWQILRAMEILTVCRVITMFAPVEEPSIDTAAQSASLV